MKIGIIDGSNYFRGLLLLIRKDQKTTESEIQLMKRVGRDMGFEPEFCSNAIHEILENKYIEDVAPQFSTQEIAIRFIRDGLTLAFSDGTLDLAEEDWLRATAEKNGLTVAWFCREQNLAVNRTQPPSRLEVDDLTVEYS